MAYRVDMDGDVAALIRHLHPEQKRKIKGSLRAIAREPLSGKPLQENLAGLFSYRVGGLRIIYSTDAKRRVIHLITIGPRRTVYEGLERELVRERTKE